MNGRIWRRAMAVKVTGAIILILTLGFGAGVTPVNGQTFPTSTGRIAGWSQYETAANIAGAGWPTGSEWAILVNGTSDPDAVTAVPLAGKYKAPILLTEAAALTPVTKDAITALGVNHAIIVGGPAAVSPEAESELIEMGVAVQRLAGNDRYDTSVAVANYMSAGSTKLAVTGGDEFSNALNAASYAGIKEIPIVLTPKDYLNDSLKQFLANHDVEQSYLFGSTGTINDPIIDRLPNVTRITGHDQFETNLNLLQAFGADYNFDTVFLVGGDGSPDAIAGAAYAAKLGVPYVVIDTSFEKILNNTADARVRDLLVAKKSDIKHIVMLGGEIQLPDSLVQKYIGELTPVSWTSPLLTYSLNEISKMISPSVVYIKAFDKDGNAMPGISGFVVDADGKIATNYHGIQGAYSAQVKMADGAIYAVSKVLGYNPKQDIVLLKINATGLKPVILGDSNRTKSGQKVFAIGDPAGAKDRLTVDGAISMKTRVLNGSIYFQISAPIAPGCSGGALVNEQGEVIGITKKGDGGSNFLDLAVPVNLLKPLLTQDIGKTPGQLADEEAHAQ